MAYARLAARILLGLGFVVFGAAGWVMALTHAAPPPPPTPMAGAFFEIYARSHWLLVVDTAQLVGGALVLAGVYVPLGLCVLGGILVNVFAFHAGLDPTPAHAAPAVVCTLLWLAVASGYPGFFRMLFSARSAAAEAPAP